MSVLWNGLLDMLMAALQSLYGILGDYGFAIVALTLVIRVAMIPLTVKQTRSMHEMQRIQPKIKEIQKKYKDDKNRQQQELMKFYEENKVNPFGGCLPLLLQMPVLFALFRVLQTNLPETIAGLPEAQQVAAEAFWVLLPNLTISPSQAWESGFMAALPYLVFVVLFAATTYLPQRMITKDPQQARMGGIMSAMMLLFGWSVPAGVLVYWVTSSVWQMGQQYLQLKLLAREEGA